GQAIAVLDSGVDATHPFLAGKVVSEACYSGSADGTSLCPGGAGESVLPGSGAPCPPNLSDCFHGTAVAGVAAGHGTEFSGVARDARIIAIQVFSQCGEDCIDSANSDWLAGVERVLELGASFEVAAVNMSFSSSVSEPDNCDTNFPAVKAAMDNLRAAGIAPVAASGNEGSSRRINFPGCISGVISVGSVNQFGDDPTPDQVSRFSNSSPALDLLAPGSGIDTSVPGGGFDRFSGTSMAAPHVSGAWALLRSKAPTASLADLLSVLTQTGVPVADSRNNLIRPRIQVDAALDALLPRMSYASGTRLSLTARPEPGYRFTLWRGCDEEEGNRCVVAMDGARRVTAVFEPLGENHPNLITTSLAGPSRVTVGAEAAIAAGIHNQGPVAAGPFRLGFYLSQNPEITADDAWFAACTYEEGLEAGQTATCRRSFPVPLEVPPGRYYLGAVVDDLDRVAERSETNNALAAASGPIEVLASRFSSRSFIPVILSAEGRRGSFYTSELILTNRGSREAHVDYTYTAHAGGGSGRASDTLRPGEQKIRRDAFDYLRRLGAPVRGSGNRIGTLGVEALSSAGVGLLVRTSTRVPEGRAGLAYPGIAVEDGFHDPVYLCGLRQNSRDRSNLALQHMGTAEDGPLTLTTWVFSGEADDHRIRVLEEVTLQPGGFHQFTGVLGRVRNGYAYVESSSGDAPFYAYGVINDQANSDGSFVFPVTPYSLEATLRHTLPVIVEAGEFTSELTVTNFSGQTKTLRFDFVADGLTTPDRTARFALTLDHGEQRIIPDVIHTEMRRKGVEGIPRRRGGLAGALFATAERGDMSGIVIGARTGSSDGRGGRYGVFYNAVPDGAAFTGTAWVDGLRQDGKNRSNLALVNTGEVDSSPSVFELEIYDGDTGRLVRTVTTEPLPARRWHQINGILANHARGTTQGYVRVRKTSGNNPFLAYGVVNDGGAPGERSGDGAYLPARE
ncbi:MAG: S8 family serine peptidase, partial [Acidobacteriota bacterium]|nr:S8 family serine peptidase [Acidobacteriota bacterium]